MRYWVLFLMIWLADYPALASRRALLVAISHYPLGRPGTSAARDQYYMKSLLHQQQFDDIVALSDNQATSGNIRFSLNQLLRRCQPGDKVVFHYAGHGTQLPDQNGDEKERDKNDQYDEALVPYDAPRFNKLVRINPGPFIRDDEIALFLSQLRDKLGPAGHILLLIDACHAGTLTRGQARLRTDQYTVKSTSEKKSGVSDWLDPIPSFSRVSGKSGKVVLMAGSQAGEANYETLDDVKQSVGSLTYAFSRAMSSISARDTYQSLFERVKTELRRKAPEQIPTVEGDTHELVLAGEVISASVWDVAQRLGQKTLQLAKGLLAGYGAGSIVRISRGDGVPIQGQVVESQPFASRIQLQDSLSIHDSLNVRVNLIRQSLPELSLRLSFRSLTIVRKNQVLKALEELPNVHVVNQEADWIIEQSDQQLCILQATNGQRVSCVSATKLHELVDQLMLISRMTLLRNLTLPEAALQATITVQNARLVKDGQQLRDTLPTAIYRGWNVFHPGQQAWLRLTNVGEIPFFFALIDLQPDAKSTILLPNDEYAANELFLGAGQTMAFPVSRFTPPYGQETYKLLLTKSPVNWPLQILSRAKSAHFDNSLNPYSFLFDGPTRGQTNSSLLLNEVGITTLHFWIKPTP